MKKMKIAVSLIISVFLLSLLICTMSGVFAVEQKATDAPKDDAVSYTITVPFELPEEEEETEEEAKKPTHEDLTDNFLNISSGMTTTFNTAFITRLKNHFNQYYPILAERFNYGVMYDINYDIGELEGAAAYQMGTSNPWVMLICFIPSHFKSNPTDIHTITHEMTHALQGYKDSKYGAANTANGGSWITEGIADVSRYCFDSRFSLPSFTASQSYTDSYRVTARFFLWVNTHLDNTFVEQFHEALKCEAYSQQMFVKITGYTLDELWQMYADSDHSVQKY